MPRNFDKRRVTLAGVIGLAARMVNQCADEPEAIAALVRHVAGDRSILLDAAAHYDGALSEWNQEAYAALCRRAADSMK